MNATIRFVISGTMPLGALLGGVLAEWLGVRTAILVGVGGTCLAFAWVYFSPQRYMKELPGPADAVPRPAPRDPAAVAAAPGA